MATMKEYVDEVALRLARYSVVLALDDPTLVTFVSRARRRVQASLLGREPEHFGSVLRESGLTARPELTVQHPMLGYPITVWQVALPTSFLEPVAVYLEYTDDGRTIRDEARRVDHRELHIVQRHSWNYPSPISPVYCVERAPGALNPRGLVSGIDTDAGTLAGVTTEWWYTQALDELELFPNAPLPTSDLDPRVPWVFEELVVYETMLDAVQKLHAGEAQQGLQAELELVTQLIGDNYVQALERSGRGLPSRENI